MEWIDLTARWSHIAAGVIALLVAPIAMVLRKGGASHRLWGKVYYWSMAWIFASTVILVLLRPNIFLLAVGVLSFYSAFTAVRVLRMKRPERDRPTIVDWAGLWVALAIGSAVIIWGAVLAGGLVQREVPGGSRLAFAGLGIFFGISVVRLALDDLRRFRSPPTEPKFWWYHHMGNMLGSYIGALTAFMVQTVSRWMGGVEALAPYTWVVWVLPAAIGTPLITHWINSYRRTFAAAQPAPADVVPLGNAPR